ncbi:MAG: TadE family protein, partial [Planctomycetota bacterium]
MIEFVLCIPLLAFVIMVIFFFGWAMSNQQQVKISGRYAAWGEVRGKGLASPQRLNSMFFSKEAGSVSVS